MQKVVERKDELDIVLSCFSSRKGSLITLQGRPGIGKSTFIKSLSEQPDITVRHLSSTPPHAEISDEQERQNFAAQVREQFDLAYEPPSTSWRDLIYFVVEMSTKKRTILVFDEVCWLAKRSEFPIDLLIWEVWERSCAQRHDFIMLLSGSSSQWMHDRLVVSEGFVGRFTCYIALKELRLPEIYQFLASSSNAPAEFELFKLICAFGGVPMYLQHIDSKANAEENILALAFNKTGPLYGELAQMLTLLFPNNSTLYMRIIESIGLAQTAPTTAEISEHVGKHYTGGMNQHLETIERLGLIARVIAWDVKQARPIQNKHRYVLADNFTALTIRAKHLSDKTEVALPADLTNILGLQFSNVVLSHVQWVLAQLNVTDPIYVGRFFQTQTPSRAACHIDLLIQTRYCVYVCDCRLMDEPVPISAMAEFQQKVDKIPFGKGARVCPVLIHCNGVTADVESEGYYSHVIDMTDALNVKQ